jgi:hypothetical protein
MDTNATPEPTDTGTAGENTDALTETPVAIAKQHDPDAAWGTKTAKDGREEGFYGYHEHTLVSAPSGNQPKDAEPRLIVRFELTPADEDIVDVSLSLLDRLATPADVLIVDRH